MRSQFFQGAGRAITAGAIGGGTSEALGGRFEDGFWFAFGASAANSIYRSVVRYDATWEKGGEPVQKTPYSRPVEGANNFGVQGNSVASPGFWDEGGTLSRIANKIPGMNAIAGMHDEFVRQFSDNTFRAILNVPLMIPAAGLSVAALAYSVPIQVTYSQHKASQDK